MLLMLSMQQAPAWGSIEGVVVKWGKNEPRAGAGVEWGRAQFAPGPRAAVLGGNPNAPLPTSATTSSDGRFVLRSVAPGSYRLTATLSGSGYMPAEYGQRNSTR